MSRVQFLMGWSVHSSQTTDVNQLLCKDDCKCLARHCAGGRCAALISHISFERGPLLTSFLKSQDKKLSCGSLLRFLVLGGFGFTMSPFLTRKTDRCAAMKQQPGYRSDTPVCHFLSFCLWKLQIMVIRIVGRGRVVGMC